MLGLLDWGVGSLYTLQVLHERCVGADVVVLSDAGTTPYGRLSEPALRTRLGQVLAHLASLGASEVLVACHAASSVLGDIVPPVPTRGVVSADGCPSGRLGLVGGDRTVGSRAWRRALSEHEVVAMVSAQPWSALVELGHLDGPVVEAEVARVLALVGDVDVLVLACTHYQGLAPVIRRLRPGLLLWDPALALAASIPVVPGAGLRRAQTTGDPAALRDAAARLGLELSVERISATFE